MTDKELRDYLHQKRNWLLGRLILQYHMHEFCTVRLNARMPGGHHAERIRKLQIGRPLNQRVVVAAYGPLEK